MLIYNNIFINLVRVHEFKREAIYNGTDYVRTRYTLKVRGVINPFTSGAYLGAVPQGRIRAGRQIGAALGGAAGLAANLLKPPAVPLGGPTVAVQGQQVGLLPNVLPGPVPVPGVVSDAAIRHDLMQPCRQLLYEIGGFWVLVSPLSGLVTDANNGPRPLYCHVVQASGPKTVTVEFGIQTDLNECVTRGSPLRSVLSHSFSTEHVLDQDFFNKKVTKGRVVFDSSIIQNNGLARDDWRSLVFHPIPPNCKRDLIQVRALEDGVTYEYRCVDQEMPFNIASANVTRIEGEHLFEMSNPERERIVAETAYDFAKQAAHMLSRVTLGIGAFAKAAAGLTLTAGSHAWNLFATQPVSKQHIIVRVWGNRNSTRPYLESVGAAVINARLAAFKAALGNAGMLLSGQLIRTVNHITQKHVQVEAGITAGPISTARVFGLAPGIVPPPPAPGPAGGAVVFPTGADDTPPIILTSSATKTGGPPDDGVSRGTFIEDAISNAIRFAPCAAASGGVVPANRDKPGPELPQLSL